MCKIVVNNKYKNDPTNPASPVPELQADKQEFPKNDEYDNIEDSPIPY